MNKRKIAIIAAVGVATLLLLGYRVIEIPLVPEKSLPEVEEFDVSRALNYAEFTGEEEMRKTSSVIDLQVKMFFSKEDHWDEVDKALEESDRLEEERMYWSDLHYQKGITYDLQENGIHLFGYVIPIYYILLGMPKGTRIHSEFEIEKEKNELEILREDLIRKKIELKKLIMKRDINIRQQIWDLMYEIGSQRYYEKRMNFLYNVTFYKLKKGAPLEMLPPWEEGEHYLKHFYRFHVWIGMYDTEKPSIGNYIGSFTTDEYTSDMNFYWQESLKRNKGTKSIRIKWIYFSEEHKIVWEGNKNANEEWYTFAKFEEMYTSPEYNGDIPEGFYIVVNMSSLDYPEFKQYYVVSYRPKSHLYGLI